MNWIFSIRCSTCICNCKCVWFYFLSGLEVKVMKINKYNALRFWEECYGSKQYAEDFHGNLMCKDGYGNNNFSVNYYGQEIYCGWNIHHILPLACGGTNAKSNLLCTNIATNEEAGDRITFWIGESLYQVKRIYGTRDHEIIRIE